MAHKLFNNQMYDLNEIMIEVKAEIENITYNPTMCRELKKYSVEELFNGEAFDDGSFLVELEENEYAISWWVTPKRTRSYPRSRVYDTYNHKNRVTIIPLVKDEGKDGDRDYLQWDTISLMSLLQVNVIIAPYKSADKNNSYENKITNQRFDYEYIKRKFKELQEYQSDALHWNLKQAEELEEVAELSERYYYEKIRSETEVEMHSRSYFKKRLEEITKKAEIFKQRSRELAREAQHRESLTLQPKESTRTEKGIITIKNYLGGEYCFTTDEIMVNDDKVFLIEKKHTRSTFPSLSDIKNGLVRMILFKNLAEVKIEKNKFNSVPILGVTGENFEGYCSNHGEITNEIGDISSKKKNEIDDLMGEADENDFIVIISEDDEEIQEELYNKLKDVV